MKNDSLINLAYSILPDMQDNGSLNKHVSIIMRGNKILSVGFNKPFKTHPVARQFNHRYWTIHSELDAIIKIRNINDLSKCDMYNIRLSTDSLRKGVPVLRNSKPCLSCQKMILAYGIKRVYYTCNDTNIFEVW